VSSDRESRDALEARIAAALDAGELDQAAHETIAGYGPEILGFLVAVQRDEADARDVFSQFSEDLWRGLAKFRRESSMRTWSYKLAHHALVRFVRDPYRRRGRRLATEEYSELVERVSSRMSHERASKQLEAARRALDAGEQALLVLRVDRKLAWDEIAEVMAGDGETADAAALRKRFERIKQRLKKLVAS
jgi:RNA polymerase sigma-70 factor (ECF subfamily)